MDRSSWRETSPQASLLDPGDSIGACEDKLVVLTPTELWFYSPQIAGANGDETSHTIAILIIANLAQEWLVL